MFMPCAASEGGKWVVENKSLTKKVSRFGDPSGLKYAAVDYSGQRCKSCLWKTPQLP